MPRWLVGARPSDHEPSPEGPGGVPPCPKGGECDALGLCGRAGAEADGAGGAGVSRARIVSGADSVLGGSTRAPRRRHHALASRRRPQRDD